MVLLSHYVVFVLPPQASGEAAAHSGLWGLATTGVDLFFVLSGFVFARTLAEPRMGQWAHVGSQLGPHLVRRFFRLYPLYAVALLAYAALHPAPGRWEAMPSHLLMLHTSVGLQHATAYNVAFWSLPPEVEFYLLLPLLALAAAALSRRGLPALALLLGAALLAKLVLVSQAGQGEPLNTLRSILTVHAPGLMVEFLLGSAVAVWGGHVQAPGLAAAWSPRARRMAAGFGLFAALALAFTYAHHLASPQAAAQAPLWLRGHVGLWAAIAYASLMMALPASSSPPEAQAALKLHPNAGAVGIPIEAAVINAALWAGRLSYGIYLFHNAAPVFLRQALPQAWAVHGGWPLFAASLALTLVVSLLLHLVVEAPCRAYGRRLASSWARATSTRMSAGSR